MKSVESISKELFNKIRAKFPAITLGDEDGKVTTEPSEARFFDFEYTIENRPLGRVSISVDESDLTLMYTTNFIKDQDSITKKNWYNFLRELRKFSKKRLLDFDVRNITKSNLNKRDYKFLSQEKNKQRSVTETKMYGTHKNSYQKIGQANLNIKHTGAIDTEKTAARTRQIESIFIESPNGERFRYPYKHLSAARAMCRHVSEGGNPYDSFGKHITGLSEELNNLKKFKRYMNRSGVMAEGLKQYTDIIQSREKQVKKTLQSIQNSHKYADILENYETVILEQVPEEIESNWIDELTVKQFNSELRDIFPYIFRLVKQNTQIKEIGPDELEKEGKIDEVDEGKISDFVRRKNYERLARRSQDKATKAMMKAADFDFHDLDNREEHEDEFMRQMAKRQERARRAKELGSDEFEEAVEKIACTKCDEVSTAAAWEKNGGFCPKCKTSSQGVAESETHGNSKIYDKCWSGYEKVPGKKRGEKGSCRKKEDSNDQESEQLPITEFILSHYNKETGAWPRGETAVLTGVEKDYGENFIKPAKQFIEKINQTFQQYQEGCDCEKDKDEDETIEETDADGTTVEVAVRDALIANEIGKDLFRGDYENDGSTIFVFHQEDRADDFESELRKQGIQIVNTQDEEFERLKHLAGV